MLVKAALSDTQMDKYGDTLSETKIYNLRPKG